jgi:enamine deaminase RidA (YjgF/YER057c/UK114 family)
MEQRVVNPWRWQDQFGFSQAIETKGGERVLYCSGQTSNDTEGRPTHMGDMRGQTDQALDNLEAVLSKAGFSLSNVVRLNYYTTDPDLFLKHYPDAVMSRLAKAGCQPSSTLLGVARLAFPGVLIEIEATAVR